MKTLFVMFTALVFSACVPATVPVQLAHTPGPGVTLSGQVYNSGTFRAEIPDGWRVITSAAGDPVTVIFAAPDSPALIMLGENIDKVPPPAGYDGELVTHQQVVALNTGSSVTAVLNAAPDEHDRWLALFERVVQSIQSA